MEAIAKDLAAFEAVAAQFVASHPSGAIVGLVGDLGAGKTTFVRACVAAITRSMGRTAPRVTSPSFVLHQQYATLRPPVDHFDLYRLEKADEAALLELGYPETWETARRNGGFLFVEWPERAEPREVLSLDGLIHFEIMGDGARRVRWTG